jgi:hypothetical protein
MKGIDKISPIVTMQIILNASRGPIPGRFRIRNESPVMNTPATIYTLLLRFPSNLYTSTISTKAISTPLAAMIKPIYGSDR